MREFKFLGCVLNVDWFFITRGLTSPPCIPGAGYDPERCDAGAWVSAAGCVRLFFGEMFVSSSRFFAEWRNKSFAGLRHIFFRVCCHIGIPRCKNILWDFAKAIANKRRWNAPCFAYAKHYTPNPSIFSQKINFIISPQREQSVFKKFFLFPCINILISKMPRRQHGDSLRWSERYL